MTRRCDRCNTYYDPESEDGSSAEYCESCESDRTSCEHCHETVFCDDPDVVSLEDSGVLCESCADAAQTECRDCEEKWIEDNEFPRSERKKRERPVLEVIPSDITSRDLDAVEPIALNCYCMECATKFQYCDTCSGYFDTTDHSRCPHCGTTTVRCEHTADLLADIPSGPFVTIRPVSEFNRETDSGDLGTAISTGHWGLAAAAGQCLIVRCRHTIARGDLFLRNSRGFGYCRSCAETATDFGSSRYNPPPIPLWAYDPLPDAFLSGDNVASATEQVF